MARALAAALAVSLLAVSGAGGADAQTPRVGGTVVFGNLAEPPCLNVLVAACGPEATRFITEMILQPAFDVSPKYTFRPRLISHVDFTTKPPFTLTYHIRPEARWSDGAQITAKDFLFTHRAIRKYRPDPEDPHLTHVRSVRALDAKTVRVVLTSRFSGWRSLFANVLPWHVLQGEDLTKIWTDGIDDPRTERPIGSGPFLLETWERGRQLTLVRNPRYWGAHRAYLDRIVIRFRLESENPVDWFRDGELDVADSLFPDVVPALRREPGVKVLAEPSATYQSFQFRKGPGGHLALRRKPVRRAIAYALDRGALIAAGPGQINPNLQPLQSLLFLAQSPYYRPHWSGYRYRPTLASRLFAQAGCRKGVDDIYSCAGERLSLRFVTVAGNPGRARILSLAQLQLRRSGVEVTPLYYPPSTFFGTVLPRGDSTSRSPGSQALRIRPGTPPSAAVAARTSPVTASGS